MIKIISTLFIFVLETNSMSTDKLEWKDFLLFIKKKYYRQQDITSTCAYLRRLMGVTQEMVNKGTAKFSELDFIEKENRITKI
jgi:hypothetical protein